MKKYIDLSRVIENEMPVYQGDPKTAIYQQANYQEDEYNAFLLTSGMHAGSHIDFPLHFFNDRDYVSDYPLDRFIGKAKVFDVRKVCQICYKKSYDELIFKDDIILFYTGFDQYYGSADYYKKHPVITQDLADFLVSRQVKLIALDAPSPDCEPYPIHSTLLNNDIFIIENLCNLDRLLPYPELEIIAFPLKIKAEASLLRVVGVVTTDE